MKKRVLSVLLILAIFCTMLAGCAKTKATTMRILKYQGSVTLKDNGKYKKIKEDLRLNSGNDLSTFIYSSASIGLDDEKIVTMDQNSEAIFKQDGKKLEMDMTKGSIFFEVKKPLEEDETFEITTSTMIVGIRGTSGYVEIDEDGNERVIVTDGVVHVIYTDPETGEIIETDVRAGEEVRVFADLNDYYKYLASVAAIDDGDEGSDGTDGTEDADVSEGSDGAESTDGSDGTESTDGSDGGDFDDPGYHFVGNSVSKENFPSLARNYILENEELKEKISEDIGEDRLDEILWDPEVGYELSPDAYGSYVGLQDVINALQQLEMVFRIASFTLNRDADGLRDYLESKYVPGAEYITEWGMKMLDAISN